MDKDNDPRVVAHRVGSLETSLALLAADSKEQNKAITLRLDRAADKLDELTDFVRKNACPSPGSCVPLTDAMNRLQGVVGLHEDAIQKIRIEMATNAAAQAATFKTASASLKTAFILASSSGSIVALAATLLVQWFSK